MPLSFLLACHAVAPEPGRARDTPPASADSALLDSDPQPVDSAPPADSSDASDTSDTAGDTQDSVYEGPMNVLFVLLDDVGVDKVGAYGVHHQPAPTPTIDALAAEGVLFENAWTYPACSPTRAALLTGRYATRTGMGTVVDPADDDHWLLEDEVALPQMLWQAVPRYASGVVGKWHLVGWQHPGPADHPTRQGFSAVRGTLGNLEHVYGDGAEEATSYDYWQENTDGELAFSRTYVTTAQADSVLALSNELREPWFLLAAFTAPHQPFHVPPDDLTTLEVDDAAAPSQLYAAMLESADTELGRVLEGMEPDVLARTVVVVMGDNGTPGPAAIDPARTDRAKETLYDGGVNVPLIVTGPVVAEPGRRSDALVHVVDLFPTLAELAGVDVSTLTRTQGEHAGTSVTLDGTSFLPLLEDPAAEGAREYLHIDDFETNSTAPSGRNFTVRSQGWKLIDGDDGDSLFRYDGADYAEGTDLHDTVGHDQDAAAAYEELKAELERWREGVAYGP